MNLAPLRTLVVLAVLTGAFASGPATASAQTCDGPDQCGVPNCWNPDVRARPGLPRALRVHCPGVRRAELATPPAQGAITDVRAESDHLLFTVEMDEDAPRYNDAGFRLYGEEGSVVEVLHIEVVPRSQNSAPVCRGDKIAQRSDGSRPVDVFMHPYCYDPDGDAFTMEGGGPGYHPASPMAIRAGESESNWSYRTATHAGSETGTVFATDELGARSADALLEVTVGPAVDRLPWCGVDPSWNWGENAPLPISARPGVPRRFRVACQDPDSDPFEISVVAPPERGRLTAFDPGPPQVGFWGLERQVDAVYTPDDDSLEPDAFELKAAGTRGEGRVGRVTIMPRPFPENVGNGGCGYSPVPVKTDTQGTILINCSDEEGDRLGATVTAGALHGTAGPPSTAEGAYGSSDISIPYTPDAGYRGYDCVKVRITDGFGFSMDLTIDIWVGDGVSGGHPPPPPGTQPGVTPVPPPRPDDPDPPRSLVRKFAEHFLRSDSVKRTQGPGDSEIWTPRTVSKRALLRTGRAPSLLFLCGRRCTIRTEARLATGQRRRAGSATRQNTVTASADQGRLVWLDVARGERRSLRRAHRPRAEFKVRMRVRGARRADLKRSLRIAR